MTPKSAYGEDICITNVCLLSSYDKEKRPTAFIPSYRKVKIYATSDKKPLLVDFLRWAAPRCLTLPVVGGKNIGNNGQAGSNTSYVGVVPAGHQMTQAQIEALQQMAELSQMLNGLEKVSVDDESRRESLLDKLCSAEDVLKLPEHKNPPGIANGTLVIDLLKHQVCSRNFGAYVTLIMMLFSCQKQALQWCIDKEYPKPPKDETPVQFWIYKEVGGKVRFSASIVSNIGLLM